MIISASQFIVYILRLGARSCLYFLSHNSCGHNHDEFLVENLTESVRLQTNQVKVAFQVFKRFTQNYGLKNNLAGFHECSSDHSKWLKGIANL